MTKYSYEKRVNRAMSWVCALAHYTRLLWKVRRECYPPLGPIETLWLADKHVHNWVWGYISYNQIYLPRRRMLHDKTPN